MRCCVRAEELVRKGVCYDLDMKCPPKAYVLKA
jgi:hypothetical protein